SNKYFFDPARSDTIDTSATNTDVDFREGNGWSLANNASTLVQSPTISVTALDTTTADVNFRKGYSVFGTFSTENGDYVSTRDYAKQFWFRCEVFAKEGDSYFLVSESHMLPDGKFEIPGLIDGKDYYIHVCADGYPCQFWSPAGANSSDPDEPYRFSTTSFVPLNVVIEANPEGYYPHQHYEPVSIWSFVDEQDDYWIELRVDESITADSLALFSSDGSGSVIKVYSTAVDSSRNEFRWRETRTISSMNYSYIAVAYSPDGSYRSHVTGHDTKDTRLLPDDSLWLDVFGQRWGIQIGWGAGNTYQPSETDTIILYSRAAGEPNWNEMYRRPSYEMWFDDHTWNEDTDSGTTFQYKARLLRNGTIVRWSPIVSFTISDQFLNLLVRGTELRVGPDQNYRTIQEAVDAAGNYDRIMVEQAEYTENITLGTKKIEINGLWKDNKPPVINGSGGTGISIEYAGSSMTDWGERVRIYGFKFKNCATAIKTESEIDISNCLFVGGNAIVVDIDSAGMVDAMKTNPFVPGEVLANAWSCTFIGTGSQNTAITLSAKGSIAAQGDSIPPDQYPGSFNTIPPMLMPANAHIGNSIFSGYDATTIVSAHLSSFLDITNADFWPATSKPSTENVHFNGSVLTVEPQFVDETFYYIPAGSQLKSAGANGEPIGYGSWQHEKPEYYDTGPGPVENFAARVAGLNSIGLSWAPPAGDSGIVSYVVYRVDANPDLWYVNEQSEWDFKQQSDEPPAPLDTTAMTHFIDKTVEADKKYIYAVAAIDSDSNHGEIRFPSPPPLENYMIGTGYDAYRDIQSIQLPGNQWHMISPWGLGSFAVSQSKTQQIFHWDDSKAPHKLYDQYTAANKIESGKGYWYFNEKDTVFTVDSAFYDSLVQNGNSVRIELTHGESGWNQISSPFPFPVAPDWLSSFHPNAWVGGTTGYSSEVQYLMPWQAVWVYTPRDTVLTLKGDAYNPGIRPLAKAKKQTFWEIRVTLDAHSASDRDNYLGVLPVSLAKSAAIHRMEPPPAFGYPQLYFLKSGDATRASTNPEERLARHYKPSSEVPGKKLEWMVGMSASSTASRLSFDKLANVPEPVHVFWITSDTAINLREAGQIEIPPHDKTRYGYIVATANPLDIALYTGRFRIRKNFPNPFRNITTLEYVVPYLWRENGSKAGGEFRKLSLKIYDIKGRCVATLADGTVKVGVHRTVWKGTGSRGETISTGFYIARMKAEGYHKTIKMMKVK
ncbi:MAG: hypothetical protein GF350_02955, partial [Chitinivibrionales bacterium]|nr:hypothetical protein [Chitinivibrionales bacterium]